MSRPNIYEMPINAGTTFRLGLTLADTDITGYSFACQFRREYRSNQVDLDLTLDNGGFNIISAQDGQFEMVITPQQTNPLNGTYVYDIEATSSTGEVTRILQGNAIVWEGVTRD